MGKIIDALLYGGLYSTIWHYKNQPEGGSFQVSFSLMSWYPTTKCVVSELESYLLVVLGNQGQWQ